MYWLKSSFKNLVVQAETIYVEFLKFRYVLQESGLLFHCNIEMTELQLKQVWDEVSDVSG